MIQLFLSLITFLVLTTKPAYAQNAITYPIPELGNCADKASCRTYCSDVLHREACTAYGTSKGLLKTQPLLKDTVAVAEKELGCSSAESCKAFCDDPAHYAACDAFAKKNNLSGGYKVAKEKLTGEIIQQVSTLLGNVCTDYASCKTYCDEPLNRVRCTEVAKQLDLKGGIIKRGPGGCTTDATCKVYCSDPSHFNECKPYVPQTIGGTPEPFRGPGGCTTEQSCRLYCLQHPESCHSSLAISPQPSVTLERSSFTELRSGCSLPEEDRPEELKDDSTYRRICVGTPENFSDYALYCKQFPTKCGSEGYNNFCREFPYKCGLMENRQEPTATRTPTRLPTSFIRVPTVEEQELEIDLRDDSHEGSDSTPSPTRFASPTRTPTLRPTTMEQTINTFIVTPTKTPTRSPSPTLIRLSPSPTPTRPPENTSAPPSPTNTKAPSPTRLPTYTKTPTVEPTKSLSSGPDNSGSGSIDTNLTSTPAVRGASTTLSAFDILLRFLFGR